MPKHGDVSVVVRVVSRHYRVPNSKRLVSAVLPSRNAERKVVRAVDEVSIVAWKGECIGVLGRNGSGKSTLMRLIAGNENPDSGSVLVSSAPTLLNVSAALQPRLSGLTNIKLGLLAQGIPLTDVPELSSEIQEFAELGDAIYRPMSTYSSGMGARLKFAISTAVDRDILLVDEALGTGDAAFAERAHNRMQQFLENAGTIFFVSHSMESIKSMCTRAIWLDEGRVVADGEVEPVSLLYRKWIARTARNNQEGASSLLENVKEAYRPPVWA